jgi:predicted DNA-binding transcriptional regulator YafY
VYDVLLSFGDKCECLAPPHVRRELKRKIEALAALYV